MWIYQKNLEFPVKIKKPDPRMATTIITQYGGPDGELAASLRYLSQRYAMPTERAKASTTKCIRLPGQQPTVSPWMVSNAFFR